jgi:recombination protein RecT
MTQIKQTNALTLLNEKTTKGKLQRLLPPNTNMNRFLQICFNEIRNIPALLKCKPESVVDAIGQAARLGLEIGGTLGHTYLLPYGDTCQFIIGYKGLKELAFKTGLVSSIEARVVYENDHFDLEYGLEQRLIHRPVTKNRGKVDCYYGIATLKDGTKILEMLTLDDIDKIKNSSRSANSKHSPWYTHEEEMGKKTVIRRICKLLPQFSNNDLLQEAISLDEKAEIGMQDNSTAFTVDGEVIEPQSTEDQILEKLG